MYEKYMCVCEYKFKKLKNSLDVCGYYGSELHLQFHENIRKWGSFGSASTCFEKGFWGTVWICVWDHVCKCWVKNRDSFGVNAETSAGEKDERAKAMTSRGIHGHLVTVRGWRNS